MIVAQRLLVLAGRRADEAGDQEPAAANPEKDQSPQGLDRVYFQFHTLVICFMV